MKGAAWRGRATLLGGVVLVAVVLLALSGSALTLAGPSAPLMSVMPPMPLTAGLPSYSVRMSADLAYGPLAQQRLDLCRPVGLRGPLPLILAIHGGAWVGGDKAGLDGYCRLFASVGFAAASINYRLAPRWVWPAQLEDVQLAVRYLRAHAAALDLNPRAVCALGDSAGGHLALYLGSLDHPTPGDTAALYTDQSPQVQCVIDLFGPADLTRPMPLLDTGATEALMGGATRASDPAAYRAASPIFDVSSRSAPTLIVQGDRDIIVPPEQSLAMAAALRHAGVAVTYLSYQGGHEFGGLSIADRAAIGRAEARWLLRWYSHFR